MKVTLASFQCSVVLVQVEFNFLDVEKAQSQFKMAMSDLDVESYEIGTGTATSDYYLVLEHVGGRISGRLEYNAELFRHATAQRMAADWQVGDLFNQKNATQAKTSQHACLHAPDIPRNLRLWCHTSASWQCHCMQESFLRLLFLREFPLLCR
jgi:hypothetical protein